MPPMLAVPVLSVQIDVVQDLQGEDALRQLCTRVFRPLPSL
jgi:hypothetical protein